MIVDGQPVNASASNAAWISKNTDDYATSKIGFQDPDTSTSGTNIENIQREANSIWSFIGALINQSKDYLPSWSSNYFGSSHNTVVEKIEAIDAGFNPLTGTQSRRAGTQSITSGDSTVTVTFTSPFPDTTYAINFDIECTASLPIFIQGVITSKSVSGFTVTFNAPVDAGYVISYTAIKAI